MKNSTQTLARFFDPSVMVSSPPSGAVNVRVGEAVEGPGGKWVPCATKIANGTYCAGLFQVGPGRRQVCATHLPVPCPDEALSHAFALAACAAS